MSIVSFAKPRGARWIFFITLLEVALLIVACPKMDPPASSVDRAVKLYQSSLISRDEVSLNRILADKVRLETPVENVSLNKTDYVNRVLSSPYPLKSITSYDVEVTEEGDTATYCSTEVQEADSPNTATHVGKYTYYFERIEGEWKLAGVSLKSDGR